MPSELSEAPKQTYPGETEARRRELPKVLDKVEAILKLAASNFPSPNTDVRILTSGGPSTGSAEFHWYDIQFLVDAGRLALSEQPHREGSGQPDERRSGTDG